MKGSLADFRGLIAKVRRQMKHRIIVEAQNNHGPNHGPVTIGRLQDPGSFPVN